MRCVNKTHIALQFREGRDEGNQTKCFDFFFEVFGGEKFFQIFLGKEKKILYIFFFSLRIFFKIFFTVVCRYLVGSVSIPGPP